MTESIKPKPFDTMTLNQLLEGPLNIDWLVEPLIPPGASGVLIGDGGIGKSWLTLELILAVASGRPWLGHFKTRKGPVLVVDEENAKMLLRIRLRKLIRGHEIDKSEMSPVYFMVGESINLTPEKRPAGNVAPSETFGRLSHTVNDLRPSLITFDSLTRVHTSNENSSTEMSSVFRYVRQITKHYGCSTWFTHHTNKQGGYRGSTDIRNFVDYALTVDSVADVLRIQHNKSRWGELEPAFTVQWNNNEAYDSLSLTHVGKAPISTDGRLRPWDFIRGELLKSDKVSRKQLIKRGEKVGLSVSSIDKTIGRAKEQNPPLIIKTSAGREAFYSLADKNKDV